jgi:enoyl-[acyl-carrier protein] reductase II
VSIIRPTFSNRITRLLGVDIPIANAPMGGVATPVLVAAMAEAGAIPLLPGSVGTQVVQRDIRAMRQLTARRFGVNLPIAYVRDPSIVDMLVDEGIDFVTTSAGSPKAYTPILKDAGMTVFHAVLSLDAAKEAVDVGVDALVVEGFEGAGLRGGQEVSSMVLLPLIARNVDVPIVAAGGIADGVSMAAAFALGAEGVQMGTRMLASSESVVHRNLKQAIVGASEVDTVLVNRPNRRTFRVLRTEVSESLEWTTDEEAVGRSIAKGGEIYLDGDLSAAIACVGQVSGRIDEVLPVAEIIRRTVDEFGEVVSRLGKDHMTERGEDLVGTAPARRP